MSEETPRVPQLNPDDFKMTNYEGLKLEMPQRPAATDQDVDAQLFGYLASSGMDKGLAELDDEWVRDMFGGIGVSTMSELRASIKVDLNRQSRMDWDNLKVRLASEQLAGRLEGDIPAEVLDANVEASRGQYEQRLREMGTTKARYLADEGLTEEQYEQNVRDDVAFQLKLNMALDKMVEATTTTVPNNELTEYLACDDPERFLADLRESGRVEEARQAASRVKIMRRLLETAEVDVEGVEKDIVTKGDCREAVVEE